MLVIIAVLLLTNVCAWIVVAWTLRRMWAAVDRAADAVNEARAESEARQAAQRRLDYHLHERSTIAIRRQNEAMMQAIVDVASSAAPTITIIPPEDFR